MVVFLNYSESIIVDINMRPRYTRYIAREISMFRMGKACRYATSLTLVLLLLNIMPLVSVSLASQDVISETIVPLSISANDPHGPIAIDGDANFSAAALAEGWTGDGSAQDPYIIENYDITMGTTPEASISITNTRVNYTIRGCNLIGPAATPSYGIYLVNSTNGRIVNNMITNFATGLNVTGGCRNLVVTGNNISYNSDGIWWDNSDNLTITDNHCSHNFFAGIYISDSDEGTISGNNCSANGINGIRLYYISRYHILTDNICNENTQNTRSKGRLLPMALVLSPMHTTVVSDGSEPMLVSVTPA